MHERRRSNWVARKLNVTSKLMRLIIYSSRFDGFHSFYWHPKCMRRSNRLNNECKHVWYAQFSHTMYRSTAINLQWYLAQSHITITSKCQKRIPALIVRVFTFLWITLFVSTTAAITMEVWKSFAYDSNLRLRQNERTAYQSLWTFYCFVSSVECSASAVSLNSQYILKLLRKITTTT